MFFLNLFTAVALIFESYNQGVFGTVSETPGFIDMVNIGSNDRCCILLRGDVGMPYWRFV
jgi:hypothetical protein